MPARVWWELTNYLGSRRQSNLSINQWARGRTQPSLSFVLFVFGPWSLCRTRLDSTRAGRFLGNTWAHPVLVTLSVLCSQNVALATPPASCRVDASYCEDNRSLRHICILLYTTTLVGRRNVSFRGPGRLLLCSPSFFLLFLFFFSPLPRLCEWLLARLSPQPNSSSTQRACAVLYPSCLRYVCCCPSPCRA